MDLTWTDEQQDFRREARAWLELNLAEWRDEIGGEQFSGDTREGFAQQLLWERRLFDDGWSVVAWEPEHGGRGATLWEWLLWEDEYWRAGAAQRVTQNGIQILGPSLYEFGTAEQRDQLLPRIAAAQDLWCQGWSEPNSGSDLASVTSRAPVDGGWVLDGQKTWTTRGAFCSHLFGLFRSDPESERHRGLTYLLVPLDTPGVTVRGFGRLDGDEGFAEVFFTRRFWPKTPYPAVSCSGILTRRGRSSCRRPEPSGACCGLRAASSPRHCGFVICTDMSAVTLPRNVGSRQRG